MADRTPKPTDAELAILQVLWKSGPSTVKAVHEIMGEQTGYTTVLKMLQIMTEKALVRRDESLRAHVYEPCFTEDQVQRQLVSGLLDKAFRGSAAKLVMQALSSKRATARELSEIRKIIQKLSKDAE